MLYVAYGSNLNKDQMEYRISTVKPYGTGFIYNWRLAFHGNDGNAYATIVKSPGDKVPVVIYEMSDDQELIMDSFEGYPKSYYKRKIAVFVKGKKKFCTVYIMNESRVVARPSRKYVNTIRRGYEFFGLSMKYLEDALQRNSRDFYLDDTFEVREFKKVTTKQVKGKSGKKINAKNVTIWKQYKPVPSDIAHYMGKHFPDDPYWAPVYGNDDDYSDLDNGSRRPSLDYYDSRVY